MRLVRLSSDFSNPAVNPNQFEAVLFLEFKQIYAIAYCSISIKPYQLRSLALIPLLFDFYVNYYQQPVSAAEF